MCSKIDFFPAIVELKTRLCWEVERKDNGNMNTNHVLRKYLLMQSKILKNNILRLTRTSKGPMKTVRDNVKSNFYLNPDFVRLIIIE